MTLLKGVLKNAFGEPMPNHTIMFTALRNTQTVLNTVISEIVTSDNGSYEKNIYQGKYQIDIFKDGLQKTTVGVIELYSDSPDADINTYLTLPGEAEVTPEFIQQVVELKNQAIQAADSANQDKIDSEQYKNEAKESETKSKGYSDSAIQARDDSINIKNYVESSVSEIESSKTEATQAAASAQQSAANAYQYEQESEQNKSEIQTLVDQAEVISQQVSQEADIVYGVKASLADTSDPSKGDAMIGVKLDINGASPRTQHEKNKDKISVKDFGAKGDGVNDDSAAFSAAAKGVLAKDISPAVYATMPHSLYCEVHVPAGTYLLNSMVDVGGRTVSWITDSGATFSNPSNINGRIFRPGVRNNNPVQHGTLDSACGYSVSANRGTEAPAQILGVTAPNQLAVYIDRDSVGFHAENFAPPLLASISSATYAANKVTLGGALSDVEVKLLRPGMIIDTRHTPTKYTGVVTGWSQDGTSIDVEGWYLADGANSSHQKVTPSNGPGININPFTKAWAMNANVFLEPNSHAVAAVGFELGVSNNKFDYDQATESWNTWCYDSITLGSKLCETAYMQRGYFYKGFESRGAIGYNYTAKNSGPTSWASGAVYHSNANSDFQIRFQPELYGKKQSFAVTKEGNLEVGRTDAAQSTFIDFHSSGNDIDYDARILVSGGSSASGNGTMTITASQVFLSPGYIVESSSLRPSNDATKYLGTASNRWNTVFASTGTINTSDINKKVFHDLEENELKAASIIKGMLKKFQFTDSIEEKGEDKARYHFGVGAQYVRDVLIDCGLKPEMYAFLCYNKWDDEYEDIYQEVEVEKEFVGKIDQPVIIDGKNVGTRRADIIYTAKVKVMQNTGEKRLVKEAGELYGIRYEELLSFLFLAQEKQQEEIIQRLSLLEK